MIRISSRIAVIFAVTTASCMIPKAAEATDFASPWIIAQKSSVRIVLASKGRLGVEFHLAPGAVTYWRTPGDAGAPPTFDFSGSSNVASITPRFPAPKRITEPDGTESFGYDSDFMIPLDVVAKTPSAPVVVALNLNYAVCEKLCLPAHAKLNLAIEREDATPFDRMMDIAMTYIPVVMDSRVLGIEIAPTSVATWNVCFPVDSMGPRDIFLESPPSWWFSVEPIARDARDRDCFSVQAREKPVDGNFPVEITLTVIGGKSPVETKVNLEPKL